MPFPTSARLVEVGPRDGLQNEPATVTTLQKITFVDNLAAAGLKTIEVGSFVSPRHVPSMADTAAVCQGLHRRSGVVYTALVPNQQGLEAALAAQLSEVAIFASASETFSQRNINCSIDESLKRYRQLCAIAHRNQIRVRGYVSCVGGCPYEGAVAADSVLRVASELLAMGCYEISLGDTIGVATPPQVEQLLNQLTADIPPFQLAVHFHDTWGLALTNIWVALQAGIHIIDASTAGLGGCPFAPGAAGNVATEDVLHLLDALQIHTGVDLQKVAEAGRAICSILNRIPTSKAAIALAARQRR